LLKHLEVKFGSLAYPLLLKRHICLSEKTDYTNHLQAYGIAKSVARFSMGLTKNDDTGRLIDNFIDNIKNGSSAGFCNDSGAADEDGSKDQSMGGVFDINGIVGFVVIRQALQLHANINLREHKLPSLRTYAEKYIRMLPDIVRQDGLGFIYGRGIGAYGQMHCISILLQGMRDGWIHDDQKALYYDILRRLFLYFFETYLDHEHGYLVIRDKERSTDLAHTTRLANFDGGRYLCQWSRLARSIGGDISGHNVHAKTSGRFVIFDKSNRKEQGLFIYQDTDSGLHIQIPLVASGQENSCDSLAFPHCPGIFDWPANQYLPIMLPELTFNGETVIPTCYGKRCVTGMGLRRSFYFRYEQPDFITRDDKVLPGMGNIKVSWNFTGNKVTCEFVFMVKNQIQMDRMRYVLALGAPHSQYRIGSTYTLGPEGLRCKALKNDFQAVWQENENVENDSQYKTCYGNIRFLQTLSRDHPLIMRPGKQYCLKISFEPDIIFAEK